MLWIPITVVATAFQVARNALQRSLLTTAGPWGATLVRFLFGLPFSLLFVAVVHALTPGAHLVFLVRFWIAAAGGAAAQMGATAALLVAMRRSSFALGTAFQQSGLPFSALMGLAFFGDHLHPLAWAGVALASLGLIGLSWPERIEGPRDWSAAWLGLASGAAFALSANAFRQAGLAAEPAHPVLAAVTTVALVQAMQSAALTIWLAASDRPALFTALTTWRQSMGAGFCGAAASAMWFTALALSPAGPVRAVGVVEMPLAALAGRRLFAERLTWRQAALGAVVTAGVVLAALA